MCTPGARRGCALVPESLTTYCRRQGQPSKVPSVPSTFSELEALGTEDLAAAVTDEERFSQIVRDLMAASNVVQVGVWRQPNWACMSCGLSLFPELVTVSGPVCLTTASSNLGNFQVAGASASPWRSAMNLRDVPGAIWQGSTGRVWQIS